MWGDPRWGTVDQLSTGERGAWMRQTSVTSASVALSVSFPTKTLISNLTHVLQWLSPLVSRLNNNHDSLTTISLLTKLKKRLRPVFFFMMCTVWNPLHLIHKHLHNCFILETIYADVYATHFITLCDDFFFYIKAFLTCLMIKNSCCSWWKMSFALGQ